MPHRGRSTRRTTQLMAASTSSPAIYWWVGAYIEAGMSTSGSSGTPYLPFVFQDATKAQAEKDAGAKLLAGPFDTQAQAQDWADAYEKNPSTLHAGSGLSPGTGTVKGDNPPVSGLASFAAGIEAFFRALADAGTWISLGWLTLGILLIMGGLVLWARRSSPALSALIP